MVVGPEAQCGRAASGAVGAQSSSVFEGEAWGDVLKSGMQRKNQFKPSEIFVLGKIKALNPSLFLKGGHPRTSGLQHNLAIIFS